MRKRLILLLRALESGARSSGIRSSELWDPDLGALRVGAVSGGTPDSGHARRLASESRPVIRDSPPLRPRTGVPPYLLIGF